MELCEWQAEVTLGTEEWGPPMSAACYKNTELNQITNLETKFSKSRCMELLMNSGGLVSMVYDGGHGRGTGLGLHTGVTLRERHLPPRGRESRIHGIAPVQSFTQLSKLDYPLWERTKYFVRSHRV